MHIGKENLQNKSFFMLLILSIVNCLDCGKVVCTAFLDLRKAFDSLNHTILLDCLCTGSELTWFTTYLSNRLQRVKLNGDTSFWTSVQGRIPQCSALGPLLFVVYINEGHCCSLFTLMKCHLLSSMANYYSLLMTPH